MTKQIAVIAYNIDYLYSSSHDEFDHAIINSITSWDEVTDEEFDVLKQAEKHQSNWKIFERFDSNFIGKTVAEYKIVAQQDNERRQKADIARKAKAAKAAATLKDNQTKKKLALLKELKKEFEE